MKNNPFFLIIGLFLVITGIIFRFLHWPNATLLLIVGMFSVAIGLIIIIAKSFKKNK